MKKTYAIRVGKEYFDEVNRIAAARGKNSEDVMREILRWGLAMAYHVYDAEPEENSNDESK